MSEQPLTLRVPGHAELHLTTRSGSVTVSAEERADVVIDSGAQLDRTLMELTLSALTRGVN